MNPDTPVVALIGDVGGHAAALASALHRLGADLSSGTLPGHVTVVQVGDLIHRGPDSAGAVALADRFLRRDPDRWVQTVGNHESQLLPGGTDFFAEPATDAAVGDTVRRWWDDGLMRVAYAFTSTGVDVRLPGGDVVAAGAGDVLVTHAGLSHGAWRLLGDPAGAGEAAALLNGDDGTDRPVVWREGSAITGSHDSAAGPMWAAPSESVRSWCDADRVPPFSQVFGHSWVYRWESTGRNRWDADIAALRKAGKLSAHVDESARQVRMLFPGGPAVWAIDPGHGVRGAPAWAPLMLPRD